MARYNTLGELLLNVEQRDYQSDEARAKRNKSREAARRRSMERSEMWARIGESMPQIQMFVSPWVYDEQGFPTRYVMQLWK